MVGENKIKRGFQCGILEAFFKSSAPHSHKLAQATLFELFLLLLLKSANKQQKTEGKSFSFLIWIFP